MAPRISLWPGQLINVLRPSQIPVPTAATANACLCPRDVGKRATGHWQAQAPLAMLLQPPPLPLADPVFRPCLPTLSVAFRTSYGAEELVEWKGGFQRQPQGVGFYIVEHTCCDWPLLSCLFQPNSFPLRAATLCRRNAPSVTQFYYKVSSAVQFPFPRLQARLAQRLRMYWTSSACRSSQKAHHDACQVRVSEKNKVV